MAAPDQPQPVETKVEPTKPTAAPATAADESIEKKLGLPDVDLGEEHGFKKSLLVTKYFQGLPKEQKERLLNVREGHQKKSDEALKRLQQHIAGYKERNMLAKDIATDIMKKMAEINRENDLLYVENGESGQYVGEFLTLCKAKGIEWESPNVLKTALGRIRKAIGSVPTAVRTEKCDEYAQAFIGAYIDALVKVKPMIFGKFDNEKINEAETKHLSGDMKSFSSYLDSLGKHVDLTKEDDPEFFYSKPELDSILNFAKKLDVTRKKIDLIKDPQKKEAFTQKFKAAKLEEKALEDDKDAVAKAEKDLAALDAEADKIIADAAQQKEEEAAKTVEDAKKKEAETEADKPEQKQELQDQIVLSDPKLKKIIKDFAAKNEAIAGFILSIFFSEETLVALDIKGPRDLSGFFGDKIPGLAKLVEPQAKKLLKDKFGINTGDELKILGEMTVEAFVKDQPPGFADKKKYEFLRGALLKSGATSGTKGKVFEYILLHVEDIGKHSV